MAWAFGASVTYKYGGGSSVETTPAIATQATGSTLVAFVTCEAPFTSFTDNKSNTFTLVGSAGTLPGYSGQYTRMMICQNASGGSGHTFTLTTTATSYASICVMEFTGVDTASLDVYAQGLDTSSPYTLTLPTSSVANSVVVACLSTLGSGTTTGVESTGFTKRGEVTDGSSYWTLGAFTKGVTSTGAYTPSFTFSNSPPEVMLHALVLKEASGGGGGTEVALTGAGMTTARGSVKAGNVRPLTGQGVTGLGGTLSPLASGVVGLSGASASMSFGSVGVAPRSVALSGQFVTVQAGLVASPAGALSVTKVATAVQWWTASNAWEPLTVSATITGTKSLITFGSWWDDDDMAPGGQTALPTDNNGTFTAVVNPVTAAGSPARVQVAWQASAATGSHSITPPNLTGQGDGWFTVATLSGIASLRDTGHTRIWHDPVDPGPDPASIETITVTTAGSTAQAGDLLMASLMVEPMLSYDLGILTPSGWTVLDVQQEAVDNVGHMVIYRVAASSGTQSVTFNWSDTGTFVAEAAIAVFKPLIAGGALTGLAMTAASGAIKSGASRVLSGASASGGTGTPTAGTVVSITGGSSALALGSVAPGVSVALSGLSVSALLGDLFTSPPTLVALSGIEATMGTGIVGEPVVSFVLAGTEAVLQMGTVMVETPDRWVGLVGLRASMATGVLTAVGDFVPIEPVRTKWRRINPQQTRVTSVLNWRGKWRSN